MDQDVTKQMETAASVRMADARPVGRPAIRGITESAVKVNQVSKAVTQVSQVTQSSAASAEESAAASQEMNSQAESLRLALHELSALVEGSGAAETGAVHAGKRSSTVRVKAAQVGKVGGETFRRQVRGA